MYVGIDEWVQKLFQLFWGLNKTGLAGYTVTIKDRKYYIYIES